MVAYNFKSQFAPLVESGQKRQTIRVLGKRRPPMPGEPLQLYTGMRTKQCRKLLDPDPLCVSVMPIHINNGKVTLDGRILNAERVFELAQSDGFSSIVDFLLFLKDTHGLPFQGVLIQWQLRLAEPTPAGHGKDPTRIQLPLQEIA
jgi:hypothetical protein